jgi:hypothetical protein
MIQIVEAKGLESHEHMCSKVKDKEMQVYKTLWGRAQRVLALYVTN